jgi:hypothetical protein
MVAAVNPNTKMVVGTYGDSMEVFSLAKRIKVMVPGGNKLSDAEAQALAQVSIVTHLNPFIGEIWYIPGRGPMIGIKGARRCGNERVEDAGGKEAYWFPEILPCSPAEAGAPDTEKVAASYKCVITDSVSTRLYQKMLLETITLLRDSGSPDPVGEARQIVGKKPEWIGFGYSTVAEQSKMNKQALAMKRAEADAIKRKFDIPFGAEVAAGDTATETGAWNEPPQDAIDGDVTEMEPPQEPEQKKPIQMYRYLDQVILNTVKKVTSFSLEEAAATMKQAHDKKQIGNTLTVAEAEDFARKLIAPK